MAEQVKRATRLKRGKALSSGKGWRLVRPKTSRALKGVPVSKFRSAGERVAFFRVVG
jgi:hypothetical protein